MNRRLVHLVPAAGLAVVAAAVLGAPSHIRAAGTYATCSTLSDTNPDANWDPTGTGLKGHQADNLDITNVAFSLSADGSTLQTILTIANLDTTLPTGSTANDYQVYWTYNGTTYATDAEVSVNPAGQPNISYLDGQIVFVDQPQPGTFSQIVPNLRSHPTGSFHPGASGTVEVDVPLADVGSPTIGSVLTGSGGITAAGAGYMTLGNQFIADQDQGGNDYTVGTLATGTC